MGASQWLLLVVAATLVGSRPVHGQQCAEGVVGSGPRTRRVVVEPRGADSGTVHLFTRPVRRLALSRSNSRLLAGDSAVLEFVEQRPHSLMLRSGRDTL